MNNDALVAALGMDAVAAVHGYRLQVIGEAQRRGLRLVSQRLTELVRLPAEGCHVVDPIDIRLTFLPTRGRAELAGRMLRWNPAHGWSLARNPAQPPVTYYAGPHAAPLDLVPTAEEVLDWATGRSDARRRHPTPPRGVELDDDPAAIHRLLNLIDPRNRLSISQAFMPDGRQQADRRSANPADAAEPAGAPMPAGNAPSCRPPAVDSIDPTDRASMPLAPRTRRLPAAVGETPNRFPSPQLR